MGEKRLKDVDVRRFVVGVLDDHWRFRRQCWIGTLVIISNVIALHYDQFNSR